MKRVWRKDNKEGVSPVIATILMVAITVVLAAVLYVMVSGYIIDPKPLLTGSLTQSDSPSPSNATLRLTLSNPENADIANVEVKLFDPNNDPVADANLTWKHIASDEGDDFYTTGDKLVVSIWPTDLAGYKVVMTIDGYTGPIEYEFS